MADISPYALTSLASVKEYLQITDTSKDNLLINTINRASSVIESYCDRKFKLRTHTETHYLDEASETLLVKQFPITEITSIKDDGIALTVDELAACENREVYIKLDQERSGKIEVTYKAGYDPIPADLEQACIMLVYYYYKVDIANFSTVFAESGAVFRPSRMPPHVSFLVDRYRRINA